MYSTYIIVHINKRECLPFCKIKYDIYDDLIYNNNRRGINVRADRSLVANYYHVVIGTAASAGVCSDMFSPDCMFTSGFGKSWNVMRWTVNAKAQLHVF